MRYGKVEHNEWLLEFRFNWKESKYDVFATHDEEHQNLSTTPEGVRIGLVWKNPRKSRQKPCWEAFVLNDEATAELFAEFGQMRQAGISLLNNYLNPDSVE